MRINIPLSKGLALVIDNTPPVGGEYPTASLKKGFILWDEGEQLADEAVGFGVPVLQKGLQTIFPGAVELACFQRELTWEITARFRMNLVEKISRAGNGNLENKVLYLIKNLLAEEIRRTSMLRGLLTGISSKLRRLFQWKTIYAEAGFSTELLVLYQLDTITGKILVEFETTGLPASITQVMLMNEQGAQTFDRYLDTSGLSLQNNEIGCWDEVKAEEAWFESSTHRVGFRLGQVQGARLFRGRELVGSRLAWAGFGYSIPLTLKSFRSEMKIVKLS